MGDSHTMVFTDGASLGMHCQGAGLRDHLQAKLGFPLIQLSNQNSGGTGARRLFSQRLQANPAYLKPRGGKLQMNISFDSKAKDFSGKVSKDGNTYDLVFPIYAGNLLLKKGTK